MLDQDAVCLMKLQSCDQLQVHLGVHVESLYHPLHPFVGIHSEGIKWLLAIQFLNSVPILRLNAVICRVSFEKRDGLFQPLLLLSFRAF